MTLAEKLSTEVLNDVITVRTLKAYQKKHGGTMEVAAKEIRDGIKELIESRTSMDSWDSFAVVPGETDESITTLVYDAAMDAYEAGYMAGFKDRETIDK